MPKLEIYRKFYDPLEARIVMERLKANSVECFLTNEQATYTLWYLNIAHGGVGIMMSQEDFMKADEILAEDPDLFKEELPQTEIKCPNCGSGNLMLGASTKRRRLRWIGIIFSILTVFPAPFTKKIIALSVVLSLARVKDIALGSVQRSLNFQPF